MYMYMYMYLYMYMYVNIYVNTVLIICIHLQTYVEKYMCVFFNISICIYYNTQKTSTCVYIYICVNMYVEI